MTAAHEVDGQADAPVPELAAADLAELLSACPNLRKKAISGAAILAAAERPLNFVWDGIFVRGTTNIIAGGVGNGKSTLLFLIAAAMLSETPISLFDWMITPIRPSSFLVIIEEAPEEGTARKLITSCERLRVDPVQAANRTLMLARKNVIVGDATWLEIQKLTEKGLIEIVVIDTIAAASRSEANSETEQVDFYAKIGALLETSPEHQTTAILGAHTRKSGTGVKLEDISGSAQRAAQCDTVIMLWSEQAKNGKVTSSTIRFDKLRAETDVHPPLVEYRVGHKGIVFVKNGGQNPSAKPPLKDRVLDYFAKSPDKVFSFSHLKNEFKANGIYLHKYLDEFVATKQVSIVSGKGDAQTYRKGEGQKEGQGSPPGAAKTVSSQKGK